MARFSSPQSTIWNEKAPKCVRSFMGAARDLRGNHCWQTLSENLSGVRCIRAEEAAHIQFEMHRAAHPGKVSNLAHVTRVNPHRAPMAQRILRLFGGRCHNSGDRLSEASRSRKWRRLGSGRRVGAAIVYGYPSIFFRCEGRISTPE